MDNIKRLSREVFDDKFYSLRKQVLDYLSKSVLRKFREAADRIESDNVITMSASYKLLQAVPVADVIYKYVEEQVLLVGGFTFHQIAELYNSAVNYLAQEINIISRNLRNAVSQSHADPNLKTYNVKVNMIQVLRYRRKEYETVGYRLSSYYIERHYAVEDKDSVDLADERIETKFKS
jgi:hypothetical protein